jgi:hypothetical protein
LDTSGSYSGALRQRGQKAAVTRAGNRLKAAEATGRRRIAGGKVQGVVKIGKREKSSPEAQRSVPKVQFDAAAWQRRAARIKSTGIRRANIESGAGDFEKEFRKVQRAYSVQLNAESFLKGLTRDKRDPSGKTFVRGGEALRANFESRPRRGTASTPRGVAARNRIYDEERKAKRAANKAAKEAKAADAKSQQKPKPRARSTKTVRLPRQAGRIYLPKMTKESASALRPFMRDLPTVPTRRRPDYAQDTPGGRLKTFYLSNEQPRRASAKQIEAIKKAMSGWTHRASGLGHSQTYIRTFSGMGRNSETVRVTITRKGGPLMGGQVEVSRSVTSRGGKRGGGLLAERAVGLPRKPRIDSKPRRRKL